jgi:hypothetical protein
MQSWCGYHLFIEECPILFPETLEGLPEPEDRILYVIRLFAGAVAAPAPCFIRPIRAARVPS